MAGDLWTDFGKRYLSTDAKKKPEEDENHDGLKEKAGEKLMSTKSRVKQLMEQYGVVFMGFYVGLYLVTLGSVYEVVALKHIDAAGVVSYLHSMGVDKFVDLSPIANSTAGNFALAWLITKMTEPVRLAFTASITPALARSLGYAPTKKAKATAAFTKASASTATMGKKSEEASS